MFPSKWGLSMIAQGIIITWELSGHFRHINLKWFIRARLLSIIIKG